MEENEMNGFQSEFEACPVCGSPGVNLNVGRVHWSVCHEHKTKWRFGENLFSGWRDEPAELHARNERTLSGYRLCERGVFAA